MHCSSLEPITNLKEDSNPSLAATFRTDKPLISKEIRGFFFLVVRAQGGFRAKQLFLCR
ncbi:hypothetical protein D9M69_230000 [compost metagenome]